jgi:agmatine/peptidylarginine deiminase
MPAEFQAQEFLLLGGSQLAELHPDVMAAVVKAAAGAVRIAVLVGSPAEEGSIVATLQARGASPDSLAFLTLPVRTMWVRDFGPATVSDSQGNRSMVGFHYRERRGNDVDDGVPDFVAQSLGLNIMGSPLLAEGGDYLSNGRGLCLLSTRVVNRNAHYLEMEPDQVMANFAAVLGFEHLLLLPPLLGEPTGHVDMFCTLLAPDLAVVGRYDEDVDPANAAHLEGIVERLEGFPTLRGAMKVERIPMPPHDDDVWRTYTNIVLANEVVLVPLYPDHSPELDREALAIYRRLLPDRRVVGIDASGLIRMNGALRCVTMNIPGSFPLAGP